MLEQETGNRDLEAVCLKRRTLNHDFRFCIILASDIDLNCRTLKLRTTIYEYFYYWKLFYVTFMPRMPYVY
jgi:hypothetical protein